MAGRVVIFVTGGAPAALALAGSCAATAASLGDRVDVFLFGTAVRALVDAHGDPEGPGALLRDVRKSGGCRLLGCSASVVEDKVPLAAAEVALDAVVGWPTVVEWSRGVVDRFFF